MLRKIVGTCVTLFVILTLLVIGPIDFKNPIASLQATNAYGYGGGGGGYAPFYGNTPATTTTLTATNPVATTTGTEGAVGGTTGTTAGTEGTPTQEGNNLGGITGAVVGGETNNNGAVGAFFTAIGNFFGSIWSWFGSLFA